MIEYSDKEKEEAKAARKAFKLQENTNKQLERINKESYKRRNAEYEKRKHLIIHSGILPTERIMKDDEPVYGNYIYVIDHEGGKVIRSNIYEGTVRDLKWSLYQDGYKFTNVYTCDMSKRGLLF